MKIEIVKSKVTTNRVTRQRWRWRVRASNARKGKSQFTADSANDNFDTPSKAKRAFLQHINSALEAANINARCEVTEEDFTFVIIGDHRRVTPQAVKPLVGVGRKIGPLLQEEQTNP